MSRARADASITRHVIDGFDFPLGVYPVESMTPREGYTVAFEPADASAPSGPDGQEVEAAEWPDRYTFDIVVRASRVEPLAKQLFAMLPGRIYPILDLLGNDSYREIDPYIGYELVGLERFLDAIRRFKSFLYEDGMVGFGAMSEEPFFYIFVDEHKIITVRAPVHLRERIESLLAAFELKTVEQLSGADSALHEHRGVLEAPPDRPDLLTAEEIIEELIDLWGLELNIDPTGNFDAEGNSLGITGWRCIGRILDASNELRYREVILTAGSLDVARELSMDDVLSTEGDELLKRSPQSEAADEPSSDVHILVTERLRPEELEQAVKALDGPTPDLQQERVWVSRWLD